MNTFEYHLKNKLIKSNVPDTIKGGLLADMDTMENIDELIQHLKKKQPEKVAEIGEFELRTCLFSAVKLLGIKALIRDLEKKTSKKPVKKRGEVCSSTNRGVKTGVSLPKR